ncbi:MAG TPA: rod shape-determining protein MreD [Steroidobacteraceae bacterium]|nr:rod shape-determining protein MreD [Steroidobacteraceae bacterium]
MLFSALLALVLTVLPLPSYLNIVRPPFLVLVVLYWSMAAPRAGGVGLGWFSGLLLDVFQGPVLGEHALALAAAAYIFVREHQKIRSKPDFQQSLIVLAALAFYEGFLFLMDAYSGHPLTSPFRWIHILTGALIWAPVAIILGYRERRA